MSHMYNFHTCSFLVRYMARQVIQWPITDPETEISCSKQEDSVTLKLQNLQLDLELRFHM